MKLTIKEVVCEAILDVRQFMKYFRLYANLTDAVECSISVLSNSTDLEEEDLINLIVAETNWGIVLNIIDTKKKIRFRICDASYEDKITYIRGETNNRFTEVKLNRIKEDGDTWFVVNDAISDPEYHIDNWVSNNSYDNLNSIWEKVILDWEQ